MFTTREEAVLEYEALSKVPKIAYSYKIQNYIYDKDIPYC